MFENQYHNVDLSKRSFLVTGGAGFIGSNIVEYLLKWGAGKVRVLDNFSTGYRKNVEMFIECENFEIVEGDIRDLQICQTACRDVDYVLHQAALGSVPRSIEDPLTSNEVNISGFLNMLVASRDQRVKRFVYAASSSTYGDSKKIPKIEEEIGKPLSPYAITKYVNELYAEVFSKIYDFECIGLRYFNVFGPRQNPNNPYAAVIPIFMKAVIEGNSAVINGDGEISRDFTFVENAVQANVNAALNKSLKNKHSVFNIALGKTITLNNLWTMINQVAEKSIEPIYGPERLGDIKISLANIDKSRQELGYNPKIKFLEGLKLTYNWNKIHYDNS